jgi:hypothetical protein
MLRWAHFRPDLFDGERLSVGQFFDPLADLLEADISHSAALDPSFAHEGPHARRETLHSHKKKKKKM